MSLARSFLYFSSLHLARYLLICVGLYLLVWGWKNPWTQRHRIQTSEFIRRNVRLDFMFSMGTGLMSGAAGALLIRYSHLSWPHEIAGAGLLFYGVSFIGLILLYDTYFYWSHRLFHHPVVFKYVHYVHHHSKSPSPLTANAFHPVEAVLQLFWALPVQIIYPLPPSMWFTFGTITMLANAGGHLGAEFYPMTWTRNPVLKWLNFPSAHNWHHQAGNSNYSFYFSFWDRVMGTYHDPFKRQNQR